MIKSPLSPDPVVTTALRLMLQDAVWAASFERTCNSGIGALNAKVARYASALAAREPELDAPIEAVTVALTAVAIELHPDSPVATQFLAAAQVGPPPAPEEVCAEDEDPAWDGAWAIAERRRAGLYIVSRSTDEDLPHLPAEYREVYAAEDARDTQRSRAAIKALVKGGLRALQREGRLLPEPKVESVSLSRKTDPPGSSGGSVWGARTSYRNQRIQR